jgi:hypothetical protein
MKGSIHRRADHCGIEVGGERDCGKGALPSRRDQHRDVL